MAKPTTAKFGKFRVMLGNAADPIVYAAKDWVSWIVVAAVFSTLAAAKTVAIGS